jgi:hypothetical protein
MIDDDLNVMAKEMFELDPDEIKHEVWQTKFRPVESTRVITSESQVSHASLGQSASYIQGSTPWAANEPEERTLTDTEGTSTSSSKSSSQVPFLEMHEYRELSSVTFRQLEEQLYRKKAQMKRQATQHAAVLIPGQNVELVKTPTLQELPISDAAREEFKRACFEHAGCFKSPEEADVEVRVLEQSLLGFRPIDATFNVEPTDDDEVPLEGPSSKRS